ncbi:hypothetical protein EJB05_40769, partial [Eragrostis curvula]
MTPSAGHASYLDTSHRFAPFLPAALLILFHGLTPFPGMIQPHVHVFRSAGPSTPLGADRSMMFPPYSQRCSTRRMIPYSWPAPFPSRSPEVHPLRSSLPMFLLVDFQLPSELLIAFWEIMFYIEPTMQLTRQNWLRGERQAKDAIPLSSKANRGGPGTEERGAAEEGADGSRSHLASPRSVGAARTWSRRGPRLASPWLDGSESNPGREGANRVGRAVRVLTLLQIAPKGVAEVHEMLFETAQHLTHGGKTGIFTPMHMLLLRKPPPPQG